MDRLEEIKRILKQEIHGMGTTGPKIGWTPKDKFYLLDEDVGLFAHQICQLAEEPEPEDDREDRYYTNLATCSRQATNYPKWIGDDEHIKAVWREGYWTGHNDMVSLLAIAKAQLAKARAHEQATVKMIFKDIEAAIVVEKLPYRDGGTLICMIPDDTWHAIKDKYLKQ